MLDARERVALNVYVALCYHKLEYFDESCELLETYLGAHPSSPVAVNLKACNVLKLRDGHAAELELGALSEDELATSGSSSTSRRTTWCATTARCSATATAPCACSSR